MMSVLDGKTNMETTCEYDPTGRVTVQAHPNGATTYFSYDLSGRLSEKVTKKDSDASVLVRFAYTRDAAGNPIAIERESGLGVYYYEYDVLQRLAYEGQFVDAARQYENYYEYDATGNRTLLRHGETGAENLTYYEYNQANELLTAHDVSGWTYLSYDQNGNTIQDQRPSYTRYYDWDGRDMMTGVRSTEAGWADNVYRYDGMASRVSTLESIGLTYYTWDGIRVLKTTAGDGTLRQRQIHGRSPSGIPSVGDIAMIEAAAGDAYTPDADQVGTICKVLDSTPAVANSYSYDAFGVARSATETFANPYRFAGKPLDADSGLYHFVARQYAPVRGRFASKDPDMWQRFRGAYSYVRGCATWEVDPSGRETRSSQGSSSLQGTLANISTDIVLWSKWQQIKAGLGKCWCALKNISQDLDSRWLDIVADFQRTQGALAEFARVVGYYQYDFSHCTTSCVLTAIDPNRARDVLSAGWLEECTDLFMCLITHGRGPCYSAMQDVDYQANETGIGLGLTLTLRLSLLHPPSSWKRAFTYCAVGCTFLGWGPFHGPTPPGPPYDIFYPGENWQNFFYLYPLPHPDYYWPEGGGGLSEF